MLVIRGAAAVDVEGTREADVAIEDGEIAAVEDPGAEFEGDPDRELVVDGYLAPGLVDAHVHLVLDSRPAPETARNESDHMTAFRASARLREFLEAGVTTVRDLGSRGSMSIEAGNAVAEGEIRGPRVLAAGEAVTMTGGHGHWFGREADGPHEVRKAAREQIKRGADVIKCMATGGVLTEGAVTGAPELAPDELEALVEVAETRGLPTAAHAHGAEGIKNAARAGITSVEHGTFMDREAAELLASEDTYWVPTVGALEGIVEHGVEAGIPEWAVRKGEAAADAFESAFEHAIEAGVPVANGTDAGTPFNFHADAAAEPARMVEFGLSPERAFEAATTNAADLLDLDDVGLVREGYRADLVVLDGDPSEDPTAWQDPSVVVAGGDPVVEKRNR